MNEEFMKWAKKIGVEKKAKDFLSKYTEDELVNIIKEQQKEADKFLNSISEFTNE